MGKINLKVWNRLQSGKVIATELEPSNSSFRRWIGIYPLFQSERLQNTYPRFRYKILEYELDKTLIDKYFGETDRKNRKDIFVINDEELYEKLEELQVKPEAFDSPWNCQYPG